MLVTVGGAPSARTERPSKVANLPAGWDDLIPELNRQPEDHLVTKRTWGAFTHTDLEAYLKEAGRHAGPDRGRGH